LLELIEKRIHVVILQFIIAMTYTSAIANDQVSLPDDFNPTSGISVNIYRDHRLISAPNLGLWYVRWNTQKSGWRAGIDFRSSITQGERQSNITGNSSVFSESGKNMFSDGNVNIGFQLLRSFTSRSDIFGYWGFGPSFRVAYYDQEDKYPGQNSYRLMLVRIREQFVASLNSSIGAEWRFHKQLSFISEYDISINYYYANYDTQDQRRTSRRHYKTKYRILSLNSSILRVGLVYYFK